MAEESKESKPYLTRLEVAELLDVSIQSVDRWIAAGQLQAFKPSERLVRIRREDVDALFTNIRVAGINTHVQEVPDA